MSLRGNLKSHRQRLLITSVLFFIAAFIIVMRFFDLQIKHGETYKAKAQMMQQVSKKLEPERGLIYFQDKNNQKIPVVINKKFYNVIAIPKEIENATSTAEILLPYLHLPAQELLLKLNKSNDPYEPLAKKIDEAEAEKIKSLNLKGIYLEAVNYRYYPFKNSACQVIGFISENKDQKLVGHYGLENYYNDILAGQGGHYSGWRDAAGRLIRSIFGYQEELTRGGASLVTTIDKNIQFKIEEELEFLVTSRKAESGTIIVMEPKTGRILGLANWPAFDLNKYNEVKDISVFRNSAVEDRFELGSVLKPITMAIGIENNKFTPETTYIDKGVVRVSGHDIKNYRNEVYGQATMTKVLEMSINTGAVYAQSLIGNELFRNYMKKFGFDRKTGVDLPNEVPGDLKNIEDLSASQINFSTAAFGQGISMNPLSLVRAYAIIANKGKSVTPYVVEKIIDDSGTIIEPNKYEPEQIISEKTAETVTNMLIKVVENGYGKNAAIKGYTIAGKTGTAQIILPNQKGYSEEDNIQTFMGFFPAADPKFVILVKLDKPRIGAAASNTVTYTFRDIAFYLINYYNLPPDNPTAF